MKIFLLRLDRQRHVFYSEGPETLGDEGRQSDEPASKRGPRAWITRRLRAWREAVQKADRGFGKLVRRAWRWLQRFIGPDEPLLRGLRKADAVILHHPDTMSHDEARQAWLKYLASRRRHHAIWLVVNLLLSPSLVLLAPLPGPNFVGYWFVYRAVCHALALIGIREARKRRLEAILVPNGILNVSLEEASAQEVANLAARCELRGLDVFLVRLGNGPQSADQPPPDAEEAPVRPPGSSRNATTQL